MRRGGRWLGVAVVVGAVLASGGARGETLSLRQCLEEAVQHHPSLAASDAGVAIRDAEADSVRGRLLPVLKAKVNILGWNERSDLKVDVNPVIGLLSDFQPLLSPANQAGLAALAQSGLVEPIHDRLTVQTAITVAEPITQLYQVIAGWMAQRRLTDAARLDRLAARRQIELDTARAWFGLSAATRLHETASSALKTVEAVEEQVKTLLKAEVVERNALLKVQVQKADFQKKVFQAEKGMKLAAAMLNAQMGRSLDLAIEPGEPFEAGAEGDAGAADADPESALSARPELRSAREKEKASNDAKHVAIGEMLPQITAVFQYENNQGFGQLVKENQFFGGILIEWNAWEWGASYYKVRAAEAREDETASAIRAAEDRVRLDVRARALELEESLKSVDLARTQADEAAENLRVEQLRFDVHETTVTDLLQAQTLALQTANDKVISEMKVKEARLSLRVAAGHDLLGDEGGR